MYGCILGILNEDKYDVDGAARTKKSRNKKSKFSHSDLFLNFYVVTVCEHETFM